jgi:hypothetical protein
MPYTMEDFRREYVKEHLNDLTLEERLEGLSPEERMRGLSPAAIERYLQCKKQPHANAKRKGKAGASRYLLRAAQRRAV